MKTVLLTGGTGFIGQHALAPLLVRGYAVHAVALPNTAATSQDGAVTWHVADLLDPVQTRTLLRTVRPSHLLHLAWYVEPGKFWDSPENVRWVEASLALTRAFAEAGGERAVMAGTCAEYDWQHAEPCSEESTPLRPTTLYGACKHGLHQVLAAYADRAGLSYAWGRIFSPYGPGEHRSRLVAAVIRALLWNEPALCSHGSQVRDYLYTVDLADAFVALLDGTVIGPVNLASGVPVTIKEVVDTIAEQLDRRDLVRMGALSAPANDPAVLYADICRLHDEVNWRPRFDLAEGIAQTIAWWRSHL